MDNSLFERSPVGRLQPISGFDAWLKRPYSAFAFVPIPLPDSMPLSEQTYKMVSEAERAVGRLDGAAERLPNPSLLVRPVMYREAVSTSALEGTYALLLDVLEADYVEEKQRSSEVREVLNYVLAAQEGIDLIRTKPICLTLISRLQEILVNGTRGGNQDAGRLRTGQVYIGEQHRGIERSRFVPPPAGDVLVEGMSDWEKWLNAEDHIPLLVKAAVGHYQFETLHPFNDGNGRLGRLIIVLQLVDAGALAYPILNLSPWLEPRKEEYKDLMLSVSRTGDFNPWVQFVAQGVMAQSDDGISRIDKLIEIRAAMLEALRAENAQGVVLEIVEDMVGYPVITPSQAASLHGVTYPPALAAIRRLERMGFLKEITGRGYGRVYACPDIIAAVEAPSDS